MRRVRTRLMLAPMTNEKHTLLLGGSAEARRIAQTLAQRKQSHRVIVSETPRVPVGDVFVRQFDTTRAMSDFIRVSGFDMIVDASHSFDVRTTAQAFAAAETLGLPYLRVERPAWDLEDHPAWRRVANVSAAVALITPGTRVFAATGWDSLPVFAGFRGAAMMLRQTRSHSRPAPYDFVELVFGDPPFTVADERALFAARRVDLLICRNLGGQASRPKLDAALQLDIAVILVDRPLDPAGLPKVGSVAQALDWIAAQ